MMGGLLATSAIGAALLGGVFLSFSDFVMRGLGQASRPAGMEVMQQINRTVYRSIFMALFFGFAFLSLGFLVWGVLQGMPGLVVGALAYLSGVIVMTMAGNVPMNNRLDRGEGGLEYWDIYKVRWTRLNHLRSLACLIAAAGFLQGAMSL